jgi:hypothetical protein
VRGIKIDRLAIPSHYRLTVWRGEYLRVCQLFPLGGLSLQKAGGIYRVKTAAKDVGEKTRSVTIQEKAGSKGTGAAEFFEGALTIKTGR